MKIKRPDLGPNVDCDVTASKIKFNTLATAFTYRNNPQDYRMYLFSEILLIDGQKQSKDWWGLLDTDLIDDFENALVTLVSDKTLKELGYKTKSDNGK